MTDPFRCYWIPPDICRHRRNESRETIEYIIASEDGSRLRHSFALVMQPTRSNTEATVFTVNEAFKTPVAVEKQHPLWTLD